MTPASADSKTSQAAAAGATTLDEIFGQTAARRPDALAIVDPPDRLSFTAGAARRLTYADIDRAATNVALRLGALRLPPGSVIAVQLPNIAEIMAALLGAWRAGFAVALVPLLWRQAEASPALRQVGARALITAGRIGGADYGEVALRIASDTFSLRFVCAFGEKVPDGMVPLGNVFVESAAHLALPVHRRTGASIAAITFEIGQKGPFPVPHSHAELLVGGFTVVVEAGLRRQAAIAGAMLISSFVVLASTIVPWLLTGGALSLHQPFDTATLGVQLAEARADAIVLPGPLAAALAESAGVAQARATILAVWRSPERQRSAKRWRGEEALVDVLAFGEQGLIALRRGADGLPAALGGGVARVPSGSGDGTVVMNVARTQAGTLALSGPMVPAPWTLEPRDIAAGAGRSVDTRFACRLDPTMNTLILSGGPPGIVSIGGYRFVMQELQDVVGRVEPDAVLAALPDLLAGQKLVGAAADAAAVWEALAALGVSPLVSGAFGRPEAKRAPVA